MELLDFQLPFVLLDDEAQVSFVARDFQLSFVLDDELLPQSLLLLPLLLLLLPPDQLEEDAHASFELLLLDFHVSFVVDDEEAHASFELLEEDFHISFGWNNKSLHDPRRRIFLCGLICAPS